MTGICLLVFLFLSFFLKSKITGSEILLDSRQYLTISYFLGKMDIFSCDMTWILNHDKRDSEKEHLEIDVPESVKYAEHTVFPEPTALFEPVVPFVTGLWMKISLPLKEYVLNDFFAGDPARTVKMVNLFWAFLLLCGVWTLSVEVLGLVSEKHEKKVFVLSAFSSFLVFFFLAGTRHIDRLLSEIPAMGLLVWATFFSVLSWKRREKKHFILLGLTWGILSLTKAIFFYIFPFFIFFMAASMFFSSRSPVFLKNKKLNAAATCVLISSLSLCLCVIPWMARNYAKVSTFGISDRGGEQIFLRTVKSDFVNKNFLGALYVWTPPEFRGGIGKLSGFSRKDLQKKGHLSPLNREKSDFNKQDSDYAAVGDVDNVITFYNKLWACKRKIQLEIYEKSISAFEKGESDTILTNAEIIMETDKKLKEESIARIFQDLPGHILSTIPFFYRGIWGIADLGRMGPVITLKPINRPDGYTEINGNIPGVVLRLVFFTLSFLSMVFLFVYGVLKNSFLVSFLLPVFLLMGVLAFLTNNLPRYNLCIFPIAAISLVTFFYSFYKKVL